MTYNLVAHLKRHVWGLSGQEIKTIRLGLSLGDELLKRANSEMVIAALQFIRRANSKSSEVLGTVRQPLGEAA